MKFGKSLEKCVEASDPEWAPYWLDYKGLKKLLKAITPPPPAGAAGAAAPIADAAHPPETGEATEAAAGRAAAAAAAPVQRSSPQELAKHHGEVAFFKCLRQELHKCKEFFASAETQFLVRRTRVREGWRQVMSAQAQAAAAAQSDGAPYRRLLAACVRLYKDLLLLENYAIMNYTAFSKILKKHDKVTKFCTREPFMRNVVAVTLTNLSHYPKVLEMLEDMEGLFSSIQQVHASVAHSSEEQLFIDAMRSINDQASLLQHQGSGGENELPPASQGPLSLLQGSLHRKRQLPGASGASPLATASAANSGGAAAVGLGQGLHLAGLVEVAAAAAKEEAAATAQQMGGSAAAAALAHALPPQDGPPAEGRGSSGGGGGGGADGAGNDDGRPPPSKRQCARDVPVTA